MSKKLISQIILSYRNLPGIYETLDSVLMQDYPYIEIVISDDGSPEFEDEIPKIKRYVQEHKKDNIKNLVINAIAVNGGTVKNINSALDCCTGEYIKILSAEDCLSNETVLSDCYEFLQAEHALICFGKMRGVLPDGSYKYELLACESDYDLLKSMTVEQLRNRLYARNYLPAPAWFARKELFEQYGKFPECARLIEDYPYWCHLAQEGVRFTFLDKVIIDYKLSGVSSTGVYGEQFMNDMFAIYDTFIFPFDTRYGVLQPVYNRIKKAGLNFYMSKARWEKMSTGAKVKSYLKYGIFYAYTGWQEFVNQRDNRKKGKVDGS